MYGEEIKQYEKQNKKAVCNAYTLSKEEIKEKYGEYKIEKKTIERKRMNKELKIDPELRDLLPPLTEDEFIGLEQLIINEGLLDAIKVWTDKSTGITYVIDGHNRKTICEKHNIEIKTVELHLNSKGDVIKWMVENQLSRRSLTPLQRVEIAEKYRPFYEKKAKENQSLGCGDQKSGLPKSAEAIKSVSTRDALSKMAGIGHDTYNKAKKIVDLEAKASKGEVELTEEQKEIIDKTKKNEIKVNTAHNELFGNPKKEKKKEHTENSYDQDNTYEDITNKKVKEKKEFPDDDIKQLIKEMKIPKNAEDYFNFLDEIDCIQESIQEPIYVAMDVLFERHNIQNRITQEEKDIALDCIDDLIKQMNTLKLKIKNTDLKENE